ACEMFVLGDRDFRLPGLGSYLQTAASAGDTQAIFWGVGVMIAVIVLLDQIVWRPVIAWAEKFKMEQVESADVPRSWFLNVMAASRGLRRLRKKTVRPLQERLALHFARLYHGTDDDTPPAPWKVWTGRAIALIAMLAVLYAVTHAILMLTGLNVGEYREPLIRVGGGLGLGSIVLLLLGTQWYILFNVIAGAMAIPTDLKEASVVCMFSRGQRWRKLILPGIFPYLITGLVTASGGAWNASIVAEYQHLKDQTYTTVGLGATISRATDSGNFDLLLASTIVMSIVV